MVVSIVLLLGLVATAQPDSVAATSIGAHPGDTLVVRARSAHVRIVRGDGNAGASTARLRGPEGDASLLSGVRRSKHSCAENEARLVTSRVGQGRYILTVETKSDCVSTIEMTASESTALDIDVHEGSVAVSNGTAPVTIDAGAADIDLSELYGPAHANVRVGEIRWSSMAAVGRRFDMRTSVGDVRYRIDGDDLKRDQAPGSGDRLGIPGNSAAAVSLRSGVGSIVVDLHAAPLGSR